MSSASAPQGGKAPWSQIDLRTNGDQDDLDTVIPQLVVQAKYSPTQLGTCISGSDSGSTSDSLAVHPGSVGGLGSFITDHRYGSSSIITSPTDLTKFFSGPRNDGEPSATSDTTDQISLVSFDTDKREDGDDPAFDGQRSLLLHHVGETFIDTSIESAGAIDDYDEGMLETAQLHDAVSATPAVNLFHALLKCPLALLTRLGVVPPIALIIGNASNKLKTLAAKALQCFLDKIPWHGGYDRASIHSQAGALAHCITEPDDNGNVDLQIGFGAEIPRWLPGSTVKYIVRHDTFKNGCDAIWAAQAMVVAIKMWKGRGVNFEYAHCDEEATFEVRYSDLPDINGRVVFARAFFPQNKPGTLMIYRPSFDDDYRESLANVLAHEIGHVLGLRHEFAPYKEGGCIQWGGRNSKSVMNYFDHPRKFCVTEQDLEEVTTFYEYQGQQYQGWIIRDYIPTRVLFKKRRVLFTKRCE